MTDRTGNHTPDVDYLRGVSETLAFVRHELDRACPPVIVATIAVFGLLDRAAAELGLDEDAPGSPLSASVSAPEPSGVGRDATEASGGSQGVEIEPGRFEIEGVTEMTEGICAFDTRCRAWHVTLDSPADLAELVRRAGEHTEVCR